MYLKRLDIYGFKSFGERTKLEFVPGITAVVGPNGSGKSNIADAIRWVLGEQSARSLRGSKMEDVIFGGSDGKRPLGYAEVSLTLDNSDGYFPMEFSEITVTRRVYRSGESEYFINQVQCRLKDVQDLFLDTGLGKDTYALIGQGQIDRVLNAPPEERRQMIEEAAGIVKYRARRAETQRKLEDTQQHLFRVNDIIAEIERQLSPLEKEAERARQYRQLTDKLREIELSVCAAELSDLTSSKCSIEESLAEMQSAFASVMEANAGLEAELAKQKESVAQAENNLEKKRALLGELNQKLTAVSHERSLALAQSASLRERKDETLEEIERLEKLIASYRAALSEIQSEKKGLESEIQSVQEKKESIEQETGQFAAVLKERELALATLESEKENISQHLAKLQQSLVELSERWQGLSAQRKNLLERLEQCRAERNAARKNVLDLEADYGKIAEQLKGLEAKLASLECELKERQAAGERLKARYQELGQKRHNLQSRLKILAEMEAEYEGYSRAVKSVMQAARQGKLVGIVGTVAELLTVPNQFVTAVETALGSSLQNIVTETREQAEKAIQFLKATDGGRATFLPIDGLWSTPLSEAERKRLKTIPGCVGVADELVEYDRAQQVIVSYLLGRVIVTDDMKAAIAVAKSTRNFSRIVTRDGDQISPGGAMSGGSAVKSNAAGLLTRRQEMKRLKEDSLALEKEISSVAQKVDASEREIARLQEQFRLVQEEKHELDVELAARARDLANAREIHSKAEVQEKQQEAEIARVEEELGGLEERVCALEKELSEVEDRQRNVKDLAAETAAEIEQLRKDHSAADQAINACLVELAALHEKRRALLSRMEDLAHSLREAEESHRRRQGEVKQLQERIEDAEKKVAECEQEISVLGKGIENAQAEEKQLREMLKTLRQRLDYLLAEIDAGRNSAGTLQIKLNEAQRRLDKVNLQIAHVVEKLAIDYEMTPEQLAKTVVPVQDLTAARRRAYVLRDEVKKIGTVNLNAADEYAALKERHDFLAQQREDLVNAMRSLQKVIDEMDAVSQEKFRNTFERVRNNFRVVFEQLFGGGTCDLILSDPDSTSQGLEIVAQPPGKKLQSLSLLSGGERALAALAFLFALLKEHPSPFCVLDEVDAALDEANLTRFTQLLRSYSDATQFLVITHRQGTMELADVLYGVTMGRDGISKMVSVRLTEEPAEVS